MNRIIISKKIWDKMYSHLLQDTSEHCAFLYGNYTANNTKFIVKDVELVNDIYTGASPYSIQLEHQELLRIINKALQNKWCIIDVHSHPFSVKDVRFSKLDYTSIKECSEYFQNIIPGFPYGSIVLGTKSADGIFWNGKIFSAFDIIQIHGDNINQIHTTSGNTRSKLLDDIHQRQILGFGKQGQLVLSNLKIGIIGVGGIGSMIYQQLGHLGIYDFVIVDPDTIENTNLNRLVMATQKDVGKPKVNVLTNKVQQISDKTNTQIHKTEIFDFNAVQSIIGCDLIFGCLDNDYARQFLNEVSKIYHIPYIDCGTGIISKGGKVDSIGGKVVFVRPNTPCLKCLDTLDQKEIIWHAKTNQERDIDISSGYVSGFNVPSPSVIHLNGVISSLAIMEFFAYIIGFRKPNEYIIYDALDTKIYHHTIQHKENCFVCSFEKNLDDAKLFERYNINVNNENLEENIKLTKKTSDDTYSF